MRKIEPLFRVTQLVSGRARIHNQLSDNWNQPHQANKNEEVDLKVVKYILFLPNAILLLDHKNL